MWNTLFGDAAAWYTIPALIGTAFFLLRIVLMTVGIGADLGADLDIDDSSHAFQILSLQSLSAFAMGFGWGGFAAYRGTEWGTAGVIGAGALSGAAMVWLLAVMLKSMADLQSSGNIPLSATVGKEGQVYLTVPEPGGGPSGSGRGQVKMIVSQRQRIYDAVSSGENLPTGTRVRVVKVNDDNTLTVARA
jgi:hypothetical protein